MSKITGADILRIAEQNPDIVIPKEMKEKNRGKTPAHKQWEEAERRKLEERFLAWWEAIDGEPLEREYHFHPTRKYRADFCHLPTKVMIEIDGGLMIGGAHNSAKGYAYQQERDRAAYALGYVVYRLGTGFTLQQVEDVLDAITERTKDERHRD